MLEEPVEKAVANTEAFERRFSTQVAWTLVTRLLMIAGSVGVGIIVGRWLGAMGLGQLAVINVSVATLVQLGSAGLPSATTYFTAQDRKLASSIAGNDLVFAMVAGSVLALGLIAIAALQPAIIGDLPLSLVTIAAISIPFQLATLLGLNLLLGLGRVGRLNIFDAGSQLLTLLNAVVAVVIIGTGLLPLIALNTAAAALICVLLVWTISRAVINNGSERKFAMNVPLFWQMIRNGLKFYVSILAAALILRADLLIVNYFRGAAEAGVYAVASQFALMLMLLPGIIATLLFPRASAQPDPRGEFTRKVTRHTAFVMSVITLLSVPGSFLLPLLYGREFADVTVQLLILLPGVFFLGIEAVLVQHFNSLGLPIIIPVFWVITLVMNMALNLIFVPTFGARAAALISTLSYTLIFVLVTSYFRSSTGNRLSTTFLLQTAELRELMSMARGNFSSQQ